MEESKKYITTNEASEKWGISQRRVATLCSDGRIKGAQKTGNTWIIPCNTAKPEDYRRSELGIKSSENEKIIKTAYENHVDFIRLQFTDIFGMLKSITIPVSQLESTLEKGRMFDGSSIEGFARIEESDMRLIPDIDTFCILPFSGESGKIASLICDVYTTEGLPFEGDPRYVLKKALRHAGEMGFSVDIGPECEFFLFNLDSEGNPVLTSPDSCGYFDVAPLDQGAVCRRKITKSLQEMGFEVEAFHHENAAAQHEIDWRYCNALEAADKIMAFKLAVKTIALENNMYASFMPKPMYGYAGSGMHVNISLSKDNKNIMGGNLEGGLSQQALYFIAGILKHAKGFCAITNPLVNSYKRLVSGFEAPTNISWSLHSRAPLIRVPSFTKNNARIELRNPDLSCNPYLAFALIIESGLEGIKNREKVPKEAVSLGTLPEDLFWALDELEKDSFVKDILGSKIAPVFISSKKSEWTSYKTMVTSWEIDNYLTKY